MPAVVHISSRYSSRGPSPCLGAVRLFGRSVFAAQRLRRSPGGKSPPQPPQLAFGCALLHIIVSALIVQINGSSRSHAPCDLQPASRSRGLQRTFMLKWS